MHHDAPDRKDDRKIRCGERWRELSSTPRHLQSRDSENCGFRFLFFLKSPSNSLHFLVAVMVAMWILRCEVKRTIAARRLKDAKARSDKISACPWAAHGLPICQICQPCVIHVSNVQRIESYRVHDPCVQMARVVDLAQIWCDFVYRVEVLCERFQFQSRGKHQQTHGRQKGQPFWDQFWRGISDFQFERKALHLIDPHWPAEKMQRFSFKIFLNISIKSCVWMYIELTS